MSVADVGAAAPPAAGELSELPDAAGGGAVHFVQMVLVVVRKIVEVEAVSRVVVMVPEVTVCPIGQVVTL